MSQIGAFFFFLEPRIKAGMLSSRLKCIFVVTLSALWARLIGWHIKETSQFSFSLQISAPLTGLWAPEQCSTPGSWHLCQVSLKKQRRFTYFVIGFYHLVERCYCTLSECSRHHFTDPSGCFSFAWVTDLGDMLTRLPWKYSFSRCLLLHFYLKFSLFTYGHAFPQQTAQWTLITVLLTPHPCPSSLLSSKPVIMLDDFCYALVCSGPAER